MTWDLLSEFGATVDVPSQESWNDNRTGTSSSSSLAASGNGNMSGLSGNGTGTGGSSTTAIGTTTTTTATGSTPGSGGPNANTNVAIKGPASFWRCDYEPSNLSWSPQCKLGPAGTEWLGVVGGKGVWGVKTG